MEKKKKSIADLHDQLIDSILSHIPQDVVEHLGNTKKEMLLAIRSLIDHAVARIDEKVERSKTLHKTCTRNDEGT